MSRLARAVGLVFGYAGVSLALRMADVVDGMIDESVRQAAARAELRDDAEDEQP